jgi:hypothetical protein
MPDRTGIDIDTAAEIESPAAADDNVSTPAVINIPLRDRTFTPELRGLVSRVTGNENLSGSTEKKSSAKPSVPDRGNLLYLMHRLYYELQNLSRGGDANRLYDPFVNDTDDSWSAVAMSYEELFSANPPVFLFFSVYRPDLKAYVSLDPVIGGFKTGTAVMGLHDGLHDKIRNSLHGILITSEELSGNVFYKKIFGADDCAALYIIDTANIIRPLAEEAGISRYLDIAYCITPLIYAGLNFIPASAEEFFELISANRIAPAVIAASNRLDLSGTIMDYDKLEVLHHFFLKNKNSTVIRVWITEGGNDMLYLLKYLLNRIRSEINSDYIPVAVNPREYLLFTVSENEDNILRLIRDVGTDFGLPVSFATLDRDDYPDYRDFFYEFAVRRS